jgi:hypothetical protein
MLRITPVGPPAAAQRFVLEGRLRGPWVAELAAVVTAAEPVSPGLELDLSGVHFIDASGVRLRGGSPFVAELLHQRTA